MASVLSAFVKSCWEATIFLYALLSSSSLSSTNVKSLPYQTFCFVIFHSCFFSSSYFFFSSCSTHIFFLLLISKYQESYHVFLSSLLGPSMDLGLDLGLSASLYKSFLRISATCCVNWTNRLFGKVSPINGFGVSLPAIV